MILLFISSLSTIQIHGRYFEKFAVSMLRHHLRFFVIFFPAHNELFPSACLRFCFTVCLFTLDPNVNLFHVDRPFPRPNALCAGIACVKELQNLFGFAQFV